VSGSGVRIIAGTARGRRLETPAGTTTRPMTDRVRESVFSALDARGALAGARVLDLFAGSGVLAIEALSRGAASAVLVDRDRVAADVCRRNVEHAGFGHRTRVVRTDVSAHLGAGPPLERFGLVFLDPPYAMDDAVVDGLLADVTARWVVDDATIVVHRDRSAPTPPPGWAVRWERSFGGTLIALVEAQR
jgi:16S rRNA (guanine966-N2)-methyltransferase